jgi:galactonate dehydratase
MAALREAAGPELEIIFEVHTRLSPARAIELCQQLEVHRPFFVEDPIRSENPGAFRALREHTSVPIGTGEQLHDKWAYRELIEGELIDYLRVDICHTGGITEGKKLAHMAEVHYQELATHYTASPVSSAAMLHMNLSIANCAVQEFAPPPDSMGGVIEHDLRVEDGYLLASDKPGLGIDLDVEAARAAGSTDHEPPHLRREDGAVQDW